ncbi:MAG: hypothetical protein ACTSR2_05500 [Candidatus Hodarchaeales archaeon]
MGSTNLALDVIQVELGIDFPVKGCEITPTEQKVYLTLSLEFQMIIEKAPSFQMGVYQWSQVLPERLLRYGLTEDSWEKISIIGDQCEELQTQLAKLAEEFESSD